MLSPINPKNPSSDNWPTGVFFGTLTTQDEIIANNRGIKK